MSSRLLLALLAAASLAGCNNFLAKNNPCGGIYPADGVAEIFGLHFDGDMETGGAKYAFDSTLLADSANACLTFASGTAADDGTGTTQIMVSCHDVELTFTLPDMRPLAEGATLTVPLSVGIGSVGNTTPCRSATATLRIDRAVGAKAASPTFVTSDFLRSVTLDVTSDDASDAGDAGTGTGTCASRVTVHARADFAAKDYSQATTSGENHCPSIPSK